MEGIGRAAGPGVRALAAGLLLAAAAAPARAGDWTLVDLGTLGGPGSYATALSDDGTVVGCSDLPAGGIHAFAWRDGALQDLGSGTVSPQGNSCALAVSRGGAIAGRAASGELVVWSGGSVTSLGVQGDVGGMNEVGMVAGSYRVGGAERAFLYRDGRLQDLGSLGGAEAGSAAFGLNAHGDVVGRSNGRAFLYSGGAMQDLGTLGGNTSAARAINDSGIVVGMAANEYGQPSPFIYDGTMRALPGAGYSEAVSVNERLEVVGTGDGRRGFLVSANGVVALDALPAVQEKGWRNVQPADINNRGWIAGTATNANGDFRAFVLMPKAGGLPIGRPSQLDLRRR